MDQDSVAPLDRQADPLDRPEVLGEDFRRAVVAGASRLRRGVEDAGGEFRVDVDYRRGPAPAGPRGPCGRRGRRPARGRCRRRRGGRARRGARPRSSTRRTCRRRRADSSRSPSPARELPDGIAAGRPAPASESLGMCGRVAQVDQPAQQARSRTRARSRPRAASGGAPAGRWSERTTASPSRSSRIVASEVPRVRSMWAAGPVELPPAPWRRGPGADRRAAREGTSRAAAGSAPGISRSVARGRRVERDERAGRPGASRGVSRRRPGRGQAGGSTDGDASSGRPVVVATGRESAAGGQRTEAEDGHRVLLCQSFAIPSLPLSSVARDHLGRSGRRGVVGRGRGREGSRRRARPSPRAADHARLDAVADRLELRDGRSRHERDIEARRRAGLGPLGRCQDGAARPGPPGPRSRGPARGSPRWRRPGVGR